MKLKNFEKFVNENYGKDNVDGFEDTDSYNEDGSDDTFTGDDATDELDGSEEGTGDEFCSDDVEEFLKELDTETLEAIASGDCDIVALAAKILSEDGGEEDEFGGSDEDGSDDKFTGDDEVGSEDELYAESKKVLGNKKK